MPNDEQVLVIPEAVLQQVVQIDGFCPDADRYLPQLLAREHLSFRPRSQMESDPSFKQLIPYIILQHTSDDGTQHLFTYTRGSGQGEKRLHAKRSFGIGGHISEADAAGGADPYVTGMQRELAEEVTLETTYHDRRVGLIYDSHSEVGRVHLGVVHVFELADPHVRPNEEDISETGFVPVAQLKQQRDQLEIWSQLCLDWLFKG